MDSMKKLAIMDMHQKAKSFTLETEVMSSKRDQRLEESTRLAHIQVETTLHHKLVHKPKALFQDTICKDLMKLCQRTMFQDHKLAPALKSQE
jgi:hypothetical protein